jgi:hypothetical protein
LGEQKSDNFSHANVVVEREKIVTILRKRDNFNSASVEVGKRKSDNFTSASLKVRGAEK